MIGEIIIAHLVGDYVLQSHWQATEKTKKWWPAIVHGVLYTVPFLFITQSWQALAVIAGTHIIIDRFRLARHLVWFKNLLAPRPILWWEYTWADGVRTTWDPETRHYDVADRAAHRPMHHDMTVIPPFATAIRGKRPGWKESSATGYPADTPPWLAVWLMIIADNIVHILINIAAISYL